MRDAHEADRRYVEAKGDAVTYTMVLEQADDGGWSAMVPDLPGLVMMGDTREDVVTNAPELIRDYLDAMIEQGLPIGRPGQYAVQVEVSA